MQYVIIVLC